MEMRVTANNRRAGKNGVYSPKHNDRNFDITAADNIDPTRTHMNRYLIFSPSGEMTKKPHVTFDEHERAFYTEMFGDALEAQNEKHRKAGNHDRVKTIDEYRSAERTCPEEYLFQFGNRENNVNHQLLERAVTSWITIMQQRYGSNWRIMDVALHMDESVPHIHCRACWVYEKPTGYAVSQTKALDAMGVKRPDESKPKSQYNNPKMTWSADSRAILVELARQVGIDVIDTPVEPGKRVRELEDYVYQQTHAQVQQLEEQKVQLVQETTELAAERAQLQHEVVTLQREKTRLQRITDRLKDKCMRLFEKLARLVCADGRVALEHVKHEAQDVLDAVDDIDRDEYDYTLS